MEFLSHPPMRPLPAPSARPLGNGRARFVDAKAGNDQHSGAEQAPWKTVRHALKHLAPGETLYLREGVYYENLYISRVSRPGAPITIRSYPGEIAVIDGGLREFAEDSRQAWKPVDGPAPNYFRSTHPYPNERYVLGWFADSMVAMLTYQHRVDIEERERIFFEKHPGIPFPAPLYFGPGIWYDSDSGHIYARLSHTDYGFDHPGMADYRGVTDPREVGLVIAPFQSVPLFLDGAQHVILQDLVIRGGGENTVVLHGCQHITFDNVIIYCGTYGLRSRSSGPVKFLNSAMYGGIPPWFVHAAGCLRNIPGARARHDPEAGLNRTQRDITRLNTHVHVALEGRTEDQIDYVFPGNHHWEFAGCDFTDGFDGIHLGGECIEFHHNRLDRFFDDSIYLTPLTPRYLDQVHVYQNLFTRCLLPIGFGGVSQPGGPVYVYRNVIDMRVGLPASHGKFFNNLPFVGHFRSLEEFNWGKLFIYHNTIISHAGPRLSRSLTQDPTRPYAHHTLAFTHLSQPRRVFNNLFVHLDGMIPPLPETLPQTTEDVQIDGSVHWDLVNPKRSAEMLARFRKSSIFKKTRWEAHSRVDDPKFVAFKPDPTATNDYRLTKGSAAVGAGVPLPADLDDPLRPKNNRRPDAGAVPFGSEFCVGRSL